MIINLLLTLEYYSYVKYVTTKCLWKYDCMLFDTPTLETLMLNAEILFFRHHKKSDSLEYNIEKCQEIFPHLIDFPNIQAGKVFYKNLVKKDRLALKYFLLHYNKKDIILNNFIDVRYFHKSSNEILWIRIQILDNPEDPNIRYGSIQNITRDKAQLVKATRMAYTDKLTGLINQTRIKQKIALAILTAKEYDLHHSIIMINIDHLSAINRMFGYQITNDLTENISKTLISLKRHSDIIAHISPGRFIILLIDTKERNIQDIGERFLDTIRNTNYTTRSGVISVTASGVGCHIPDDVHSCDDAFAVLDECLTKTNKLGCDNFVQYNKNIDNRLLHKQNIELSGKIIHAIQTNKVHTAYQPIIHHNDTNKSFMECLARIQDIDGSYIPAYKFISIAENIGFIKHIDIKLFENALEDLKKYPHLKLSINLSGHTLYSISSNTTLINLLKNYTSVSNRLCIELTETIPLQDIENLDTTLVQIKQMGYKIALDDFGSGYNSFANLNHIHFDIVKIDGSYIKNVATNHKNQIFVETLTNLAKKLNIEIVAEMIDNEDDLNFIKKLNIDYYQGYYFAQPSTNFDAMNTIAYNLPRSNLSQQAI